MLPIVPALYRQGTEDLQLFNCAKEAARSSGRPVPMDALAEALRSKKGAGQRRQQEEGEEEEEEEEEEKEARHRGRQQRQQQSESAAAGGGTPTATSSSLLNNFFPALGGGSPMSSDVAAFLRQPRMGDNNRASATIAAATAAQGIGSAGPIGLSSSSASDPFASSYSSGALANAVALQQLRNQQATAAAASSSIDPLLLAQLGAFTGSTSSGNYGLLGGGNHPLLFGGGNSSGNSNAAAAMTLQRLLELERAARHQQQDGARERQLLLENSLLTARIEAQQRQQQQLLAGLLATPTDLLWQPQQQLASSIAAVAARGQALGTESFSAQPQWHLSGSAIGNASATTAAQRHALSLGSGRRTDQLPGSSGLTGSTTALGTGRSARASAPAAAGGLSSSPSESRASGKTAEEVRTTLALLGSCLRSSADPYIDCAAFQDPGIPRCSRGGKYEFSFGCWLNMCMSLGSHPCAHYVVVVVKPSGAPYS